MMKSELKAGDDVLNNKQDDIKFDPCLLEIYHLAVSMLVLQLTSLNIFKKRKIDQFDRC